ncbi:MAG: hypothetical protein KC466_00380 [Myxococcales bacterium]|nr:hypothetical protein [Myxococcales bacterium]
MARGVIHFCYKCDGELTSERPGRAEQCPKCGADVHVCKNCRFWDPSHYNECREPQAERVLDQERGNFCDWFAWREGSGRGAAEGGKGSDLEALERLFKK